MPYFKLRENDLFVNTIEAYPNVKFYVQSGSIYVNDQNYISGTYSDNITGVPRNFISLYEYNINRSDSQRIYPFVIKDGQKTTFKSISQLDWDTQFNYGGNKITSSYNLSSSITRYRITSESDTSYKRLRALTNTINHYRYLSNCFNFADYYGSGKEVNMISIPSIFYGSSIKKGTVNLKYFISGSLAAQASDSRFNGELVQVSGTTTGSIVGTVLYNEGIILLTSSVQISNEDLAYETTTSSSWCRFGFGSNDGTYPRNSLTAVTNTQLTASYALEFQGTNHVQTLTVMAKAPYNQLNHSNNPTYNKNSAGSLGTVTSGSNIYEESKRILVNVVPSDYTDTLPPFQKETYISKIGLYDKDKNLIGIAKLATPVRKTEDREFIFKLKLDL